jgi:hypothetical protein
MRNKVLFVIAILLILSLVTVRFIFKDKFDKFELLIKEYEYEQSEFFIKEKEKKITQITQEGLLHLFNQYFDDSKYFIEKDTVFSYLYLSGSVKYKTAQLKYLNCVHIKCVTERQNESIQLQIENKVKSFELKYGDTFKLWYSKLKEEKLLHKTQESAGCSDFFPDLFTISINDSAWYEFDKFLAIYNNEIRNAQIQSAHSQTQFDSMVLLTKNNLKNNVIDFFNDELSKNRNEILKTETETKTYNSPALGLIKYELTKSIFDKHKFRTIADNAFEEQWKSNSLRNGSMPYAACYGSSNSCNSWYCSQIKVLTDGSGDVLVTIKNSNGNVVRHAYIKGGYSYTFNVPDGSYQVFFYSGTGWNPNKQMQSSSCSNLIGGFVLNEDVTKDNYINLNSQIMTYELILQQQGNFSTKPSSKDEAF